jgi:hypothetical protein
MEEMLEGPRQTISEANRRDILDFMSAGSVRWSGRLDEVAFLERLWDLTQTPSPATCCQSPHPRQWNVLFQRGVQRPPEVEHQTLAILFQLDAVTADFARVSVDAHSHLGADARRTACSAERGMPLYRRPHAPP